MFCLNSHWALWIGSWWLHYTHSSCDLPSYISDLVPHISPSLVWFLFYFDQSSNNICEMQGWLCNFLVILMDWRSSPHCCPALWEVLLLQNCVLCLHPQKEECLEERESVGALCQEIEKATRERRGYNWLQCSPLTLSFRKRLSDLNSFYLICLDVCLAFWANT